MSHDPHSTAEEQRRVVLVLTLPPTERELTEDREDELRSLCDTAGCAVVGVCVQHLSRPISSTYIGKGKIEEVRRQAEIGRADEVVFDCDLSPSQQRNLDRAVKLPVIDYSALILHIFAQNARTHQARLAVELAQLQYHRSRLARLWSHLDRIKAGTNMRGPGEKQLEVDRRLIDRRIQDLKAKLDNIEERKERTIANRGSCFKVCLVGYTNAGKSTLMNALTHADVLAQDRLFATLDTRTSRLVLDRQHEIVLSDTVGFIRKLPHELIASFHATLSEVREADLLLHVVDASQPAMEDHIQAVEEVLEAIEAKGVPNLLVFNKIDRPHSETILLAFKKRYRHSVAVSAHGGDGLEDLRSGILACLRQREQLLEVRYSSADGALDAHLRRSGRIIDERYEDNDTILILALDDIHRGQIQEHPDCQSRPVMIGEDGKAYDPPPRLNCRT